MSSSKHSKRWWFITVNNPNEDWKSQLQTGFGAAYGIGQLERGENGTPHVQAVVWFKERIKNCHWRGLPCWAKSIATSEVERSIAYCTKEDTRIEDPFSFGKDPRKASGHQQVASRDFGKALDTLKEGKLKEIEANILIPYFGNCQKVQALFAQGNQTTTPRGVWVYGAPGYGKSHWAREHYPEAYIKPQNKWWDGYTGQPFVILDDLDTHGACLSHHLKIWLDQYSFEGEIKGGLVKPSYTSFVITSNYLPSELWTNPKDVEAIVRRCRFICFYSHRVPTDGQYTGIIPADPSTVDFSAYINTFFDK